MQETWLLWLFFTTILRHLLIHHGMKKNPCHRERMSIGVAIILGPEIIRAWNMAGKPPPITSASNSYFSVRMIGVTL